MSRRILIDANFPNEIRVVLLDANNNINHIEYETANKQLNKGNIYLAKIERIEPSLQAAFIDYGAERNGFLPFSEIHSDYYNIPVSDQKSTISSLKEITPPKITHEDLTESSNYLDNSQADHEEFDVKNIEKLVDDKFQSEYSLEAADHDVDNIHPEKQDTLAQYKHYKIQDVIRKGQIILVQTSKEDRDTKKASFTSLISLAGRYSILKLNKSVQNGISRKISSPDERKRLKNIVNQLADDSSHSAASIIARTAAVGRTTLEIKRDYDYLVRLWNKIRETTMMSTAPYFIHKEEGIIQKTIRDVFDNSVKEILVQGEKAYQIAHKFMCEILPNEISKIKEYKNKTPIFTKFNIEDQLSNLYQPIVKLPSGGYIVINPTEALISIDINSGRATSERNIEETAIKNNLEATREIARQVRLRDLSGLIVIDFIDMSEIRNRKIIEYSLKKVFSRDRAKIQIGTISNFGLLEMSRQRMRPSFSESNSSICTHCRGKGLVRSNESNSVLILRTVENEIYNDIFDDSNNNRYLVNVYANQSTCIYLLNNKRNEIKFIEEKYHIQLNFCIDHTASSDSYSIEKVKLLRQPSSVNLDNATTYENHLDKTQSNKNLKNVSRNSEPKISDNNQSIDNQVIDNVNAKNSTNEPYEEILKDADTVKTRKKKYTRKRINKRTHLKKTSTDNTEITVSVDDSDKE